jgi:hypothetical protein
MHSTWPWFRFLSSITYYSLHRSRAALMARIICSMLRPDASHIFTFIFMCRPADLWPEKEKQGLTTSPPTHIHDAVSYAV